MPVQGKQLLFCAGILRLKQVIFDAVTRLKRFFGI